MTEEKLLLSHRQRGTPAFYHSLLPASKQAVLKSICRGVACIGRNSRLQNRRLLLRLSGAVVSRTCDLSRTKRRLTPVAPISPIHILLTPPERESHLLCILSPRIGPTTLCIFCHHRQLLNRGSCWRACVGMSMETAPNLCRDLLDRLQHHVCTNLKPLLQNSEFLVSM